MYITAFKSTTGAPFVPNPWGSLTVAGYTSLFEAMDSSNGKSKKQFRNCQHYRIDRKVLVDALSGQDSWVNPSNHSLGYWINSPIPCSHAWAGGNGGDTNMAATLGPWGNPSSGLPLLYIDTVVNRGIPDPSNLQLLIQQSLTAMLPGIRPSLSLPNTLYELKDFKTVGRTLDRIKALGSIPRTISQYFRRLVRGGSDVYLQTQFNILPLLRDISGIQSTIDTARRELNRLISGANKIQYAHYACPLSDSYSNSDVTYNRTPSTTLVPTVMSTRRQSYYTVRSFHATMEYSYNVSNLSGLSNEMAAILDVLGVNLNPQILWNAIPWSFVVDWLIRVNKWLANFKVSNLEPTTYIHQYCWSSKVTRETLISLGFPARLDVQRITETAYKRQVTVPDYVRAIELSGLNLKEFSLAAALGLSRV